MKKILLLVLVLSTMFAYSQDVLKTCKVKSKCILREQPIPGTAGIDIKKGETVDVLDIVKDYYLVNYKGDIGYVSELFIYDADLIEIKKQRKTEELSKETEHQKQAQDNKKIAEEKRKVMLIEQYGELRAAMILRSKVCVGMSKDEAIASWGSPDEVNKTTGTYGVHEQWVYKGKNYKNRYLYLESGILKTIQE